MALTKIGATLGGSADVIQVTQSSHGLSLGFPVKVSGNGTYAHASADSAANAEAIGIIIATTTDTMTIALGGRITIDGVLPSGNLAAGTVLFLHTSAGKLTATEPSGNNEVSKPMAVITYLNSEMIMIQQRGEVISTTGITLADESVDSDHYVDGSIDTAHIGNLQVTGAKIAANTITGDKIALGSDAQGDVMYYNGTDWVRLGFGTSGHFLKTQGTGANPLWAVAGASQTPWTGNIDAGNYTLSNVGAATNDWTATTLTMSTANASNVNPQIRLISTNAGDTGPGIDFFHDSSSPADHDTFYKLMFRGNDSGGTAREVALMYGQWLDVTLGTMDSRLFFRVMNNSDGSANTTATLDAAGVWTDASGEASKTYEGSALTVWGGRLGHTVLDKIMQLGVGRYHAANQPESKPIRERHVSPTAEQFYDVFGVGRDPRAILLDKNGVDQNTPGLAAKDVAGVALMGIQELMPIIQTLDEKIQELKTEIDLLRSN